MNVTKIILTKCQIFISQAPPENPTGLGRGGEKGGGKGGEGKRRKGEGREKEEREGREVWFLVLRGDRRPCHKPLYYHDTQIKRWHAVTEWTVSKQISPLPPHPTPVLPSHPRLLLINQMMHINGILTGHRRLYVHVGAEETRRPQVDSVVGTVD